MPFERDRMKARISRLAAQGVFIARLPGNIPAGAGCSTTKTGTSRGANSRIPFIGIA